MGGRSRCRRPSRNDARFLTGLAPRRRPNRSEPPLSSRRWRCRSPPAEVRGRTTASAAPSYWRPSAKFGLAVAPCPPRFVGTRRWLASRLLVQHSSRLAPCSRPATPPARQPPVPG
eukprot:1194658-Prorocentrum_minimum.AAC.1